MTIPSFTGLQTALSGLQGAQAGIDTTGQNIANANTPGYTRQSVDLTESDPLNIAGLSTVTGSGGQLGTGVDITTINRIRDQFLDVQYRAQNAIASNSSTTSTVLQQAQGTLDEPTSSGISAQLSAFWQSWSDLSNDPTSLSARQAVIDSGTTLAQTFNQVDQQLSAVQSQAAQQYSALTASPSGEVQSDANQIASLNSQIAQAQAAGEDANNLLDQRDQLLDTLSGLAQVSVTTQSNGMVQVNFGDASSPLVAGTTVNWPQTLTSAAGGQLGALLSLSDPSSGQIQGYRTALDNVASQLVSEVNSLQPSSPFFSGGSASSIAVVATPNSIQTSSTGDAGGNDLAVQVAGLNGGAADQSYTSFVGQVGSDVQAAQNGDQTNQSMLSAIENQRQSVSGVSLDEEMTNLITYQQAYQASARVMNTINETINTLITVVGGAS